MACSEDFFSTTLEVDPPPHVDRVVVHAFANAYHSYIKVNVTKSYAIDQDNPQYLITDAEVVVSSNSGQSRVIPFSAFGPFYYTLDLEQGFFVPGETYTLSVKVDGFDEVRSSQTVPEIVDVNALEFIEDGGINNEGEERSGVDFEFLDPSQENFYEVGVLIDPTLNGNPEHGYPTYLESLDPNTHRGYTFENLLVDDASYNGELKKISLQIYPTSTSEAESKFIFQWRSITKDYYQYSRTLRRFEESKDNPFASPVQIYNNIENGIGIFSISNDSYLRF